MNEFEMFEESCYTDADGQGENQVSCWGPWAVILQCLPEGFLPPPLPSPPLLSPPLPSRGSPWCLLMWFLPVQSLIPHPRAQQLHFHYFPLFITVGSQKPIYVVVSSLLGLYCLFLNLSHNPVGCSSTKCWLNDAVGTSAVKGTLSSSYTASSGPSVRSWGDFCPPIAFSFASLLGRILINLHSGAFKSTFPSNSKMKKNR
jgi:hypothetical protein